MTEKILILDSGSQVTQLIGRRLRELGVYCEIHPSGKIPPIDGSVRGIILSGSPCSVYDQGAPVIDFSLFKGKLPVLGICYGAQLMAHMLGGRVVSAQTSEYGHAKLCIDRPDAALFQRMPRETSCWMSHRDQIAAVPPGFCVTAHTPACPVAAMEDEKRGFYALQFHPEVLHTPEGADMLRRFVRDVCGCGENWVMDSYIEEQIEAIRARVGTGRVLLALSGGVDSSVAAALLSRAVGRQLICVFVDHGLMRKGEADRVKEVFSGFDLTFRPVDAGQQFFTALKGVTDPEQKRRIIGEQFIRVFEAEAKAIGQVEFLAQGTIYPDVVESGIGKAGAVIKSHHNVGGLPKDLGFSGLIEPLRPLFKDEVRELGRKLGLPELLVRRQPFPGPGLGVRIVGEVTPEKVRIVQEADAIFQEELNRFGVDTGSGQFFAALSNLRSVGVMGDHRTYDCAVALRAVLTSDYMTATAARLPYDLLEVCMTRIVNTVPGVNRVLYDLTSKPPATIELE